MWGLERDDLSGPSWVPKPHEISRGPTPGQKNLSESWAVAQLEFLQHPQPPQHWENLGMAGEGAGVVAGQFLTLCTFHLLKIWPLRGLLC